MSKTGTSAIQNWIANTPIGVIFAASDVTASTGETAKTVGKILRFQENVEKSDLSLPGRSALYVRVK